METRLKGNIMKTVKISMAHMTLNFKQSSPMPALEQADLLGL